MECWSSGGVCLVGRWRREEEVEERGEVKGGKGEAIRNCLVNEKRRVQQILVSRIIVNRERMSTSSHIL